MIDDRYYVEAESNDEVNVWIEAVPPTWRDVPAILRGTYVPQVKRVERFTLRGFSRVFHELYVEPVLEPLYKPGPFLSMLHREDDAS